MKKIPENEMLFLVRTLGLLINQAGIYGPLHKVTQNASNSVFAELEKATNLYQIIEFAIIGDHLMVNGSSEGLDPATIRNLRDRMMLHKLTCIVFQSPLIQQEFTTCITYFATPPARLEAQGGFEALIKNANLKSIRTVKVNYERVDENKKVVSSLAGPVLNTASATAKTTAAYMGVLDLSLDLSDETAARASEPSHPTSNSRPTVQAELTTLLAEVNQLLVQAGFPEGESQREKILESLRGLRDVLRRSTAESEDHIESFASQVHGDRQTIASIESAARRRGLLKLTREELIDRYAELNQEIVQPLTVSTGVIDLLQSGQGGPLTESQYDLLKLASESVDRVNQLVAYMNRVAGIPDSFTPDAALIRETY